jgi:ferredoxin
MPHYVLENCIGCKFTDCVDVCPVDCFHEGPNFLVIDPEECIDCGLCVAECPAEAIKNEADLNQDEQKFINLNVELAKKWPVITIKKVPLPDADSEKHQPNKITKLIK